MDVSEAEDHSADATPAEQEEPVITDTRPLELDSARRLAERAVLVPIGAALLAREQLLRLVSSPASEEAQLRQFEQRGILARDRLEARLRVPRAILTREVEGHATCLRQQVRNTMRDLTSKGNRVASKIQTRVPTQS